MAIQLKRQECERRNVAPAEMQRVVSRVNEVENEMARRRLENEQ